MANESWDLVLPDGTQHRIALEHSYWTGRHEVRLDEEVVRRGGGFWRNFGCNLEVPVPGHRAFVTIRTNGIEFRYDLVVDGRSVVTEEEVQLEAPITIGGLPLLGWIIGPLCVIPAVVARNGLLAGAVGGAAGGLCIAIARQHRVPTSTRTWLCLGIFAIDVVIQLLWAMATQR